MATHNTFLNSDNFVSQKASYLDVMEEFVSIHITIKPKYSLLLFPKQEFMDKSQK